MKLFKYFLAILALLPLALVAQEVLTPNSCITCHENLDGPLANPVKQVQQSVHNHRQLSCVGCHGGDANAEDAEAAMSSAKNFVGRPSPVQKLKMCSKCHSDASFMRTFNPSIPIDQYERYLTSKHGQLLAEGDRRVATCISCHGSHDIRKVNDPLSSVYPTKLADQCGHCHADQQYMLPYKISTTQLQEFKRSIHGINLYQLGDLSAPTCNDCHGNHGAIPPGVTSIANVCGLCHAVQSEYFYSSRHKVAFDQAGISECEACHGNHGIHITSDAMLGVGEQAICSQCHEEGSRGYSTAKSMRAMIDSLTTSIKLADSLQQRARRAGVALKDDKMQLANAKDALVQARALVHSFSIIKVNDKIVLGKNAVAEAVQIGNEALKELNHRRKLLALMVVLTLLVAGCLILYIREYHRH